MQAAAHDLCSGREKIVADVRFGHLGVCTAIAVRHETHKSTWKRLEKLGHTYKYTHTHTFICVLRMAMRARASCDTSRPLLAESRSRAIASISSSRDSASSLEMKPRKARVWSSNPKRKRITRTCVGVTMTFLTSSRTLLREGGNLSSTDRYTVEMIDRASNEKTQR